MGSGANAHTESIWLAMLESDRLSLRRFRSEDLPQLIELESDAEVMKFTSLERALSEMQIKERLEILLMREALDHPLGVWAAELKDTRDFVGWFMLKKTDGPTPELGFMIVRKFWGLGFASEAAARLLRYAFDDLNLPRIRATVRSENLISKRVLRKLGFQQQSIPRDRLEIFECSEDQWRANG